MIASVLPIAAVGNKLPLLNSGHPGRQSLAVCLSSFVADYVARQKLGGTSMNYFLARQLAVVDPRLLVEPAPWSSGPLGSWLECRVLELTYTTTTWSASLRFSATTVRPSGGTRSVAC